MTTNMWADHENMKRTHIGPLQQEVANSGEKRFPATLGKQIEECFSLQEQRCNKHEMYSSIENSS